MTADQFLSLMDKHVEKCKDIMATKGLEYANDNDRLANFKQGEAVGTTKYQDWHTHFNKQYRAVESAIKKNPIHPYTGTLSEPFEARVGDLLMYSFLLLGLLEEDRVNTNNSETVAEVGIIKKRITSIERG